MDSSASNRNCLTSESMNKSQDSAPINVLPVAASSTFLKPNVSLTNGL